MDKPLRDLIHRLSQEGLNRLCDLAGVSAFEKGELGPRQLTRAFEEHLLADRDLDRLQRAEATAGEILRVTALAEFCEIGLSEAARGRSDLQAIARRETSLEDRALEFFIANFQRFRRATNVASSLAYRDGRYHCAFHVDAGKFDPDSLLLRAP
ncbi:MAG: hypothetical protein AAFQ22_04540 [Pseudomonadota bacterium]